MRKVTVAPKGMGLNDFVAMEEGFFKAEGLDVTFDWKTFRGTQSSWKGLNYLERPQDQPYTKDKAEVIQGACVWGSICNASAGMGKFVPEAYGDLPWAIFVRPDSKIREPKDLKDVPISVGMRAGSHFNVPYRLEKYLPLENIKTVNTGGFGARLEGAARRRGRGRVAPAAADRDGRAARASQDHRGHVPHAVVGAGRLRARGDQGVSARARPRREGDGRGSAEIPAAVEARGAGRVRDLSQVGLLEVRARRTLRLQDAAAFGVRRGDGPGEALGPRRSS